MPYSPRPDSFEVTDYLGVLHRRGWIALALACLGLLAAVAYVAAAPKAYMATASVYVTPNAANEILWRAAGPPAPASTWTMKRSSSSPTRWRTWPRKRWSAA